MSTTTTVIGQVSGLNGPKKAMGTTSIAELSEMRSINDLITYQACNIPDSPLIAYPGSEFGASDFREYTARELDLYADRGAKCLARRGLKPTVSLSASLLLLGYLTHDLTEILVRKSRRRCFIGSYHYGLYYLDSCSHTNGLHCPVLINTPSYQCLYRLTKGDGMHAHRVPHKVESVCGQYPKRGLRATTICYGRTV